MVAAISRCPLGSWPYVLRGIRPGRRRFGPLPGPRRPSAACGLSAVAPIPEPSTFTIWFLLGVIGTTVGWRRRRRG